MTGLPRVKGKEIVKALRRAGLARSPLFQFMPANHWPGLLRSIPRDVEMEVITCNDLL